MFYTRYDSIIRKTWLTSHLVWFCAQFFFLLIGGLLINPDYLVKLLIDWPLGLVIFLIVYYCAYRKPGTICLTLGLVLQSLAMLGFAYIVYQNLLYTDAREGAMTLSQLIFSLLSSIFFMTLDFLLLKVNRRETKRRLRHSEKYPALKACFENAKTAEELNALFSNKVVEDPSVTLVCELAYKDCQSLLKSVS